MPTSIFLPCLSAHEKKGIISVSSFSMSIHTCTWSIEMQNWGNWWELPEHF